MVNPDHYAAGIEMATMHPSVTHAERYSMT